MTSSVPLPAAMFPRIFRKDLRLLWPLALASAVGQALLAVLLYHPDPYSVSDELSAVAALVTLALAVTLVLLIVLAVQQDSIPGVTQDWLVRPIKRRDLLVAKLLTVVLLIHGPIVVTKLAQGLAEGFPLSPLLRAVLLGNLELAVVFSLPVMAVAALTRSVGEAVIGALAILLGLILTRLLILGVLYPFTHTFDFLGSAEGTGVAWVWQSLSRVPLFAATIAVLLMQYFRRSTREARVLFAVGLLLFTLTTQLPWRAAFAIQQSLAASVAASQSVSIAVDPAARGATAAGPRDSQLLASDSEEKKSSAEDGGRLVPIVLPLRVSGLPGGLILHADGSRVRLVGTNGRTLYRGPGHVFDVQPAASGDTSVSFQQTFLIPASIYHEAADQALRLEVDYSLTLLRLHALPPLAALDGARRLPEVGQCASRVEAEGTAVEVACREVGVMPCMSAALEQSGGALRNPEKFDCELDYEPAGLRFSVDPTDHFQVKLPFRDPTGVAHFPVGPSQLQSAQVVLRVYEPQDHFSRRAVIPEFRLRDWQAAPTPPPNPAPTSD